MKKTLVPIVLIAIFGWGCSMFGSWKAIPPPGGCDQCHTKVISANWQMAYRPVTLNDETGKNPWQKPESVLPPQPSPLEQKKITEQRCFRCHKGPDKAHTEYKGRYHH
ncbi:MAG: cytochrome C [Desulfuromonas sp.]|uniref:cytochrome C n=1 Tax=Desulfuromonas sp. TaxID=892 RepID=UPI000CB7C65B|nr:cytochrome C [Desulfuromonas sp.]PLX84049.1 MAG: cytochrome C [Desulfuromonas sp.]